MSAPGRTARPSAFLTPDERDRVLAAIRAAEAATSGEIRVHLEARCPGGDPLRRARRVFGALDMTATARRNGVLVYLATEDRVFAIVGDRGIDEVVPEGFWGEVARGMARRFRAGDFAGGLETAIAAIGRKLARRFPSAGDADIDELPDEISEG